MDKQTATLWNKVQLQSGDNKFRWHLKAQHSTASWRFFMTKPGWDSSKPLTRDDFNLTPFCQRDDGGVIPSEEVEITCHVPAQTGYQVILAVWDVADTPNAFYQVIDVDMGGKPSIE